MDEKKCIICGKQLDGNHTRFCNDYCAQKVQNINNNSYHRQVAKYRNRKFTLIEMRGNLGCEKCGYIVNIGALEFHHLIPANKSFPLDARNLSNKKWNDILNEFEKCKILCANCHREEHNPELFFINRQEHNEIDEKFIFVNNCINCGVKIELDAKRCKECHSKSTRRVERPPIEILIEKIKLLGYDKAGKEYGVTGNSIRKWIKNFGLDPKEIKKQ